MAELDERIDGLPAQVRAHVDASQEQTEAAATSYPEAGGCPVAAASMD